MAILKFWNCDLSLRELATLFSISRQLSFHAARTSNKEIIVIAIHDRNDGNDTADSDANKDSHDSIDTLDRGIIPVIS